MCATLKWLARQSTRGEERPRAPLMEDVQSGMQQYLHAAGAASRLTALTICKSLCHLSTFQKAGLKADSHTRPPSLLIPVFHCLLRVFVLDDQAVGWSV